MTKERVQKVLSQAGLGSRREMEGWIQNGWILVNDHPVKLGDTIGEGDRIKVKGKLIDNPLNRKNYTRILLYHKPIGEICSRRDPAHSKTVFDHLPKLRSGRWIQVGRLDINTSGLLIFTNDGDLANQLMHPKFEYEREYAVRVHGSVSQDKIDKLLEGVMLEDGLAKFNRIEFRGGEGTNAWYHVTLSEGKNREVRRLWESQEVQVSRLIRIRFGHFTLPRFLSRGKSLELTPQQVSEMLQRIEGKSYKKSANMQKKNSRKRD